MAEHQLFEAATFVAPPPAPDLAEDVLVEQTQGYFAPKRLMLVSGRSNAHLAERIARRLQVTCSSVTLKTFPSGELYARYDESIRGADVFIVQSFAPAAGMSVNDFLMELLIMVDAAHLGSAKRVTAVVPLFPYARQDKKSKPREPITARLVSTLLNAAGVDRVLTMDLHAGQVQGFFDGPVDHMTALPMFAQYFRDQGISGDQVCVVSADAGRTKLAKKFAEMLDASLAIISKDRPTHSVAEVIDVIGAEKVRGRVAIISDDMIDTAGTLCAGAEAVKRAGAARVIACATHPIFSPPALERITNSVLDQVVVSDTVPVDPVTRPQKVTVLPADGILAQTIDNIFREGSVSEIFGGENQLF
ncbi:MAG: ribose-phosphate pyrophosphokinae [Gaiellaceae bacterium]|nr:ribose-phosphate pyrophosphokinae [Gaiellaceae bacterium]